MHYKARVNRIKQPRECSNEKSGRFSGQLYVHANKRHVALSLRTNVQLRGDRVSYYFSYNTCVMPTHMEVNVTVLRAQNVKAVNS